MISTRNISCTLSSGTYLSYTHNRAYPVELCEEKCGSGCNCSVGEREGDDTVIETLI
jgi:hypothetical protein